MSKKSLMRGFCSRKGIIPKEVLLRDIDISNAIVSYITNNTISNVVVGASAHNAFFKKFMSPDVPTTLLKTSPETCAVFVVSKGKLLKSKSASQALNHRPVQQSLCTLLYNHEPTSSSYSSDSERESFVSTQHNKPMSDFSQTSSPPRISSAQTLSEFWQSDTVTSYTISQSSTTNGSSISSTSTESPHGVTFMEQQNQNLEAEVRRLRLELKQFNPSNNKNQKESSQELQLPRANETQRLDQAKEMPTALSEEKQKRLSAIQAAETAKQLAKMESQRRRLLEMQAKLVLVIVG
ncbi:Protein kinase superfamily protein [Raphanus sativus]|nr:Protein kinase superfamily protein [Raphanus sativus]